MNTETKNVAPKDYLKEEGFYVGEKLRMSQSRMVAMENRILRWRNKVRIVCFMVMNLMLC